MNLSLTATAVPAATEALLSLLHAWLTENSPARIRAAEIWTSFFYLWGVRTATYIPTLETSQECERQNHNPMLCLPGWGGVEGEQRSGSFQGQSEGCQNKEGRLAGADSQRKRGGRPRMKEAVMVSFPPVLGLWAPDGGLSEKRPPGHHCIERKNCRQQDHRQQGGR